ncbi:MAG: MBL fold metallo-hydrolase [Alphaproteobacteria bacterium]|nr:MBL fold metallo-hydrolase [Alphaproteobacteria bacterium]
MKAIFWGTRGSLPAPLSAKAVEAKIVNALVKGAHASLDTVEKARAFCTETLSFAEGRTYGGNTACVQIEIGGPDYLLCDLGTGVREFSLSALAKHGPGKPQTYHVLVSHVHWDHIMGFPFFVPAFIPGNRIKLYSCHPHLERAIRGQNREPCFPVEFETLSASIEFVTLEPAKRYDIAGASVTCFEQLHGNDSFGYRIEAGGKSVVYSTDAEHKPENAAEMERAAAFFANADLVIFDAMYSLAESISVKEDWGHSSNVLGVELCQTACAKQLCLFHHEPVNDDARIDAILAETIRFEEITRTGTALKVCAAYDGMVIAL